MGDGAEVGVGVVVVEVMSAFPEVLGVVGVEA